MADDFASSLVVSAVSHVRCGITGAFVWSVIAVICYDIRAIAIPSPLWHCDAVTEATNPTPLQWQIVARRAYLIRRIFKTVRMNLGTW